MKICSDAWILRVQLPDCELFFNAIIHLLDQRGLNPSVQDMHIDGCPPIGAAAYTSPTVPTEPCLTPKPLIGAGIAFAPPSQLSPQPIAPLSYAIAIILFWLLAHAIGVKLLLQHMHKMIKNNLNQMIGDQQQLQPLHPS